MARAGRIIGRERELAELEELLAPGVLVTATGPGGVGKTRLVDELLAGLEERAGVEVRVARLAGVGAGSDADALVGALGFESLDAATVLLTERPALLVLDNCEHVLEAARALLSLLQGAVGDLTVLATSREPLALPGEHVYVVEPLALPGPGGADAGSTAAVELFLERAASVGARLEPAPRLLADVGELCRRLDGLPLAIELAAARTRAMAPRDLLATVDQHLDVLRRGRGLGDRHDSMRAAIEVSTTLLPAAEAACFRRLAVFGGPFDLGLAHGVAAEEGEDRLVTLDLLSSLVVRSLVATEHDGSTTRYRLLELLRTHALEQLAAAGELEAVEQRFTDLMLTVADRIVADALTSWDPVLLATASTQFANLVRAVEHCLDHDDAPDRAYRLLLPMFAALHQGRPAEVWALGRRVLERWGAAPAPWRAECVAVLCTAAALDGRDDDVAALAPTVGEDPAATPVAVALVERAWGLATRPADPDAAAGHFARSRAAADAVGFAPISREVRLFEAGERDLAGDTERALELVDEVLGEAGAAGDLFGCVLGQLVRCRILLRAGELRAAAAALADAEATAVSLDQEWWSAAILRTRAALASVLEGWRTAAPRWRQAVDFGASRGALGEVAITLRSAASVAEHLGERGVAEVLAAATPRSRAVTVLPELFPDAAARVLRPRHPGPSGADLVEALLRARQALGAAESAAAAPAAAGAAAFEREDDAWRITFGDRRIRLRDMKGLGDLALLLASPGTEVHALTLMGAHDVGDAGGPAVDERARAQYQQRIGALQREIDEARDHHDPARADRAEAELDALVAQLSAAYGLGGRARATGSSAERARTAVTYRIRSAIRKVGQAHPDLGRHLTHAVRTGTWCSYEPEQPVAWQVARS